MFSFVAIFSSAKIVDDDKSISEITVSDWLIFAEEKKAANEKTQAVYFFYLFKSMRKLISEHNSKNFEFCVLDKCNFYK